MKVGTEKNLLRSGLLLLATVIWGFAFVAQSVGGELVGAYTFGAVRMLIAAAVLGIVVLIRRKKVPSRKKLWQGGVVCGILLALAINLQQLGINAGAPAGKAGFITAMYIVLVPVIALLLFRKHCGWNCWVGVALGIVSLYLLCMDGDFTFHLSDLLLLGCALAFAFQILAVDHYVPQTDPFMLSCIEFLVCGLVSAIPMLALEVGADAAAWAQSLASWDAWIPLLYAAVLSGAMGYTLQMVGQRGLNPTLASLLMSFESVFSVLAGWLVLHQFLSTREWLGCALLLVAVVLAQLPLSRRKKTPAAPTMQ